MLRIGVLVDLVGRFGRGVLEGVTTYAIAHGDMTLVTAPLYGFARLDAWDQWEIDGMIVQVTNSDVVTRLKRRRVPAINVSSFMADPGLPTVTLDNPAIGRIAADYLLERGFKHLAYLTLGADSDHVIKRGAGFERRVREAGRTFWRSADTNKTLMAWLRQMPRPMALFTANDHMASTILEACHAAGISVPEHAALLGCDNDELIYRRTQPALSSIAIPAEQIGFDAARTLIARMRGEKIPYVQHLKPLGVLARKSTDVLAITDPLIAEAVRYIRLNAHKGIRVGDVLRVVPLSRRVLERRFRAAMGRTPLVEIIRVQMDLAQHLLAETDLQMPDIAERCGFTDATYLGIAFRKRLKTTPTAFRRQFRSSQGLGDGGRAHREAEPSSPTA